MTTNPVGGAPKPAPAAAAHASAWAVAGVRDFDGTVGSIVPSVFSAYARVFHPAYRRTAANGVEPVRWREVAEAHHRVMHPLAQWRQINPPLPGETTNLEKWGRDLGSIPGREGVWDDEPVLGAMPTSVAARLAALLTRYTGTPDRCWLAVWEGYGDLAGTWTAAPRFEVPGRGLHLLTGPAAAAAFPLSDERPPLTEPDRQLHPNLWWPSDHAWCVATDVDMMTTYVGGSAEAVAAVVADAGLEAFPVNVDDAVTWDSDTVNRVRAGG
ncbi:hypothetical protein [Lentzea terrae]|uniref:hypothetical protein n=1 Tax=Lentzea terrae TaxID=2200761 RepID=UPI000DD3970A|nr:hypothetical protein [Lentzea terrae]